jgi:hypothetical protein
VLTQYYSGDKIEENEMGGECSMYRGEERRGIYRVMVGKPESKKPLGSPRRRWKDYIRIFRKWNVMVRTG